MAITRQRIGRALVAILAGCATIAAMPTIRISCDIGAEAAVSTIAGLVDSVSVVSNAAIELGYAHAQTEADRSIGELFRRGGPRAVLDRARTREVPSAFNKILDPFELEMLEQLDDRWLWDPEYLRATFRKLGPRRYRQSVAARLAGFDVPGSSPWETLLRELHASEAAALAPSEPVRFVQLRYENPFDGELLVQAGAALTGLGFVLRIMRDWSYRRRRENARAGAEARIQRALADDMEDEVFVRQMIRRVALTQLARGELDLPDDTLNAILSDNVTAAIDRLAERDMQWEQLPDPNEEDDEDE